MELLLLLLLRRGKGLGDSEAAAAARDGIVDIREGAPPSPVHTPQAVQCAAPTNAVTAAAAAATASTDVAAVPAAAAAVGERRSGGEGGLVAWLAHAASGVRTPRWLGSSSPPVSDVRGGAPAPSFPLDSAAVAEEGPPGAPIEESLSPSSSMRSKRPPPSGVELQQLPPEGHLRLSPLHPAGLRAMQPPDEPSCNERTAGR